MLYGYEKFKELSENKSILMEYKEFNQSINKFSFLQILNNDQIDEIPDYQQIITKINNSKFIIIDTTENNEKKYIISCFEKQIIIFDSSNQSMNHIFFNENRPKIYYISNDNIKNSQFEIEIFNFMPYFEIDAKSSHPIKFFWKIIQKCISAYLIKKSYLENHRDRLINDNFESSNNEKNNDYNENEFISLRHIDLTNSSNIKLCYNIKKEKLFVVKTFFDSNNKNREVKNYKTLNYFFIPKFYGQIIDSNSIVIEFIDGQTLDKVINNDSKLNFEQKVKIIIEILFTIQYFHLKNYIYRDLKPNNLIIDQNGHAVLVDFEKMNDANAPTSTCILNEFVDENGQHIKQNDILLIGKIIHYIFAENNPNEFCKKYPEMHDIYLKCTNNDPEKRPSISELIKLFKKNQNVKNIISSIRFWHYYKLSLDLNCKEAQYCLAKMYYDGKYIKQDIDKSIYYFTLASNQNYSKAQLILGDMYFKGKYVKQDINKSIHYFTLASNQNHSEAQTFLGFIFYKCNCINLDINKSIHYFTLASNQNHSNAQAYLGEIYYKGKYVARDMNKSIHYFTLASDKNHYGAQNYLGEIYYEGKYVKQDINKSIHYLTLASNQNCAFSQIKLGEIYYEGKYAKQDINKSIHYFTLASNQNFPQAQVYLGRIFYEGIYVKRDIDKFMFYFTVSAKQNNSDAQTFLGIIYYTGEYVKQDIKKSLFYFTLASNQNHGCAQFFIGKIYNEGIYVTRDINKSIFYLTLASNKNHSDAQILLAFIYLRGYYIAKDINKSIYYFILASNLNNAFAQYYLGVIYYEGKYVKRDIEKSIYYLTLASNNGLSDALSMLAIIYLDDNYIKRDINKSIRYFTLASDLNNPIAQSCLAKVYYEGKYVAFDINKSLHYFTLAANQNISITQYYLGLIYYEGKYVNQNINKSLKYLRLASDNNERKAQLLLADLYFEGKYIEQDVKEAIRLYKELSSLNDPYAKNNLGVIYKKGLDGNKPSVENAKIYFEEAIKYANDCLSMFNLANLLLDQKNMGDKDTDNKEAIILLIESSNQFIFSAILFCLILIKQNESNNLYSCIVNELSKYQKVQLAKNIYNSYILFQNIFCIDLDIQYKIFREMNCIYFNKHFNIYYPQKKLDFIIENTTTNIDKHFYEGFGEDIII